MTITETLLPYHPDLDTIGLGRHHIDPTTRFDFTAQKPYRNGVTVWCSSHWMGNGFGTAVEKIAIRDGQVVAIYKTSGGAYGSRIARVAGIGDIHDDIGWMGYGTNRRTYVTRRALSKWTEAVKAL